MKRIFSLVMILGLILTLCSCGKQERILYNVDLDKEIPKELYQMTAEVLAYVYKLKNKL